MTTVVQISDTARARADELIRSGRYTSFSDVVHAALESADDGWIDEPVDLDQLPPEHRAAVEAGLADVAAGRVYPAEEVFARLTAKYEAMAAKR